MEPAARDRHHSRRSVDHRRHGNVDYFKEHYGFGEHIDHFAKNSDFLQASKIYPCAFSLISARCTVPSFSNFKYGECYRDKTASTQVDLLGVQKVDPDALPYEGKMVYYLKEFCYTTSAHGIPMIAANEHFFSRGFWSLLYVVLFTFFSLCLLQHLDHVECLLCASLRHHHQVPKARENR